ncbi:unnamed protein product, partial [Tetraodon nigroviridis]
DTRRMEELFSKNQQMKEQQRLLNETIQTLENRLRAGLCDRCTVTQELARRRQQEFEASHMQSLQHMTLIGGPAPAAGRSPAAAAPGLTPSPLSHSRRNERREEGEQAPERGGESAASGAAVSAGGGGAASSRAGADQACLFPASSPAASTPPSSSAARPPDLSPSAPVALVTTATSTPSQPSADGERGRGRPRWSSRAK